MRTDKHPVMVAEDILHSHGGLQTCVVTEKKIIAYERENPRYNTQKGDGIVRSCNSVVSSLFFSRSEITAALSLHFQHLMKTKG
jgi:hypothetical protein